MAHASCRDGIPTFRLYALLAVVEPAPVYGAGVRLVHDPGKNGPVRLLVARCVPPDTVKDVQRHFLCGFPLAVILMTNVKTARWARSYKACSAL